MSSRGKKKAARAAWRKATNKAKGVAYCQKCGREVKYKTVEVSDGMFSHIQIPCKFDGVVNAR